MNARARSLLGTLAFLVLAAGAVAAAWFLVLRKDEAREARQDSEARVLSFTPAQVRAVELTGKGGEVTRLERAGADWKITAPVQADAEREPVDALVERLAGLKRKDRIATAPDAAALARFGLDRPRAQVKVGLEGGAAQTLLLGDENPFDGTAFVRGAGGDVDLVEGSLKYALDKGTFDLREKRLLPYEEKDLGRIEVATPVLAYALVREPDAWKVKAPIQETVDETALDRVLGTLRDLRAASFERTPAPDAAYGLDAPRWKVTMTSPTGAARTLLIGTPPPPARAKGAKAKAAPPAPPAQLFARLQGGSAVAVLPADAVRGLELDLFALRDKRVLRFQREQVALARFTVDGARFEVKNDPGTRLGSLLWPLASLRAVAFADESGQALAAHGLDHPAREVELLGADGKVLERLRVAERDGKVYAQAASSPRIVELDRQILDQLPRAAADLAKK